MSSRNIIYRLLVFCIIAVAANGCLVKPNLKLSEKPPEIVKTYKHVVLLGGTSKLKDTGVHIEAGDVYTVLVTGSIDYCPKGGCKWRNVKPELGWPFIARIGAPELSIHFRPLSSYYNANFFTRTHYNGSGNLYIGYKEGPVDTNGNALRPEWYFDDNGAFSVDIIVWQTDDWVKIADFLEDQFKAAPGNVALREAYDEAAKFRKVELAKKETARELEETKQQIKTFAKEGGGEKTALPVTVGPSPAMKAEPAVGLDIAGQKKIAELEAKLQKLALLLASLDDMKKQLNAGRQKSEKLATELDEFEAREKDLRTQLEDGSRVSPVIVVASPKNQTRTESGRILLSGVVQDDMVIIYFAGHGATERDTLSPDGDGLEKYLLPADADPDDLYASALPMRELSHIFHRLRSDRLIFIADACYSGATGGRTISITDGLRARLSDKFMDRLSSGKGRVILSASGANEVSAELSGMEHGVFTHFLIKGLEGKADANSDGLITVDEIYDYVSTEVPLATGQEQHPVKKGAVEGRLVLGIVN